MTLDEINQIIEEAKGLRNQIQNFMFDISYQLCNANKDKLDIIVDKLLNAKNSFTLFTGYFYPHLLPQTA